MDSSRFSVGDKKYCLYNWENFDNKKYNDKQKKME